MLTRARPINLLLLPGDGIGPEIMDEVKKVIRWVNDNTPLVFNTEEGLIGGAAIDIHGNPYPRETQKKVRNADAVLLGCVGGPKWRNLDVHLAPEAGIVALRQDLDLYCELRPCFPFPDLEAHAPLRKAMSESVKITIIRDLQGGAYLGEPRGIEPLVHGGERGFNTISYTTEEVQRLAHWAFKTARKSQKKLCSIDQSDLLESMQLWHKVVNQVAECYPEVELRNIFFSEAFQELVSHPEHFDVILVPNLVGEVMSTLTATLMGSPNMLATGAFGEYEDGTKPPALYHPIHGSAPEIKNQGIANPIAMIMSFAMCLRHSLEEPKLSEQLRFAIFNVLKDKVRTKDIMEDGCQEVGSSSMSDKIIKELEKIYTQG